MKRKTRMKKKMYKTTWKMKKKNNKKKEEIKIETLRDKKLISKRETRRGEKMVVFFNQNRFLPQAKQISPETPSECCLFSAQKRPT